MAARHSLVRRVTPGAACSVGAGLVFGGFIGGGLAIDVSHASGHARERAVAVVVSADDHLLGLFDGCGKRAWRSDVHWRSLEPRSGMPVEFADDTCEPVEVGETHTVVRTSAARTPDVLIDPPASYADAWLQGAAAFGLGFGVCALALLVRSWWRRLDPGPQHGPTASDPLGGFLLEQRVERILDHTARHLSEVDAAEVRSLMAHDAISAQELLVSRLAEQGARLSVSEARMLRDTADRGSLSQPRRDALVALIDRPGV